MGFYRGMEGDTPYTMCSTPCLCLVAVDGMQRETSRIMDSIKIIRSIKSSL